MNKLSLAILNLVFSLLGIRDKTPLFTEFAKHVDYINIVDDEGDLVVIFGRYEKNPHLLVPDFIKTLQAITGGELYTDENGRTILTIIMNEPKGEGNVGKG